MRHVENNIELLELSKSVAREKMSWVTPGQTSHAYLETQIGMAKATALWPSPTQPELNNPVLRVPAPHHTYR